MLEKLNNKVKIIVSEKEDKYYNSDKLKRLIFISSIIGFMLAIYLLNSITPLLADDYGWGYIFGTDEPINNIKDIFTSVKSFYINWGGRITGEFYNQLFTLLGKPIFNIVNTIVYILDTLLIYYICNRTKKVKPSLYIGINLLIWFFTPDYGQVVFWMSGAVNYLWAMLPILVVILVFRRYTLIKEKSNFIILIKATILFIVGIVAGISSENASAGMLIILTLYLVYFYLNKIKIESYLITTYFGSIIGYASLVLAPGNAVRKIATEQLISTSLIFRIFMITYFWIMFLFGLFLLLVGIYFIGKRYFNINKDNAVFQSSVFIVGALISAYCMIASPTSPERTWFCVVIFIIIAIGIIYSNYNLSSKGIDKESILMIQRLLLIVTILSLCKFAVMYVDTGISIYEIKTQSENREMYIMSEKANGNLNIVTPIIIHKYPFLSNKHPLYGLSDIKEDPNYFINQAISKYYGIDSIIGVKSD